jgi:hypothetical protein
MSVREKREQWKRITLAEKLEHCAALLEEAGIVQDGQGEAAMEYLKGNLAKLAMASMQVKATVDAGKATLGAGAQLLEGVARMFDGRGG